MNFIKRNKTSKSWERVNRLFVHKFISINNKTPAQMSEITSQGGRGDVSYKSIGESDWVSLWINDNLSR